MTASDPSIFITEQKSMRSLNISIGKNASVMSNKIQSTLSNSWARVSKCSIDSSKQQPHATLIASPKAIGPATEHCETSIPCLTDTTTDDREDGINRDGSNVQEQLAEEPNMMLSCLNVADVSTEFRKKSKQRIEMIWSIPSSTADNTRGSS